MVHTINSTNIHNDMCQALLIECYEATTEVAARLCWCWYSCLFPLAFELSSFRLFAGQCHLVGVGVRFHWHLNWVHLVRLFAGQCHLVGVGVRFHWHLNWVHLVRLFAGQCHLVGVRFHWHLNWVHLVRLFAGQCQLVGVGVRFC